VYLPRHFQASDSQLADFLRRGVLAELVTRSSAGLTASTLPLLFDPGSGEHGAFVGHLARANPQWSDLVDDEALVIVRGPDAYVSPSYYESHDDPGRVVPTWNYLSVQGHGRLVVHDDSAWTSALVQRLTAHHETGRPDPWSVSDAPAEFVESQLRAIVGIEIALDTLEGKWKLSQNRERADFESTLEHLADGSSREREVAEAMRQVGEDR
jgi:transcriptional regulator